MSKREVLDAIATDIVTAERHRRQDIEARWANGEVYEAGRVSGLLDAFIAVHFNGDRLAQITTRQALIDVVGGLDAELIERESAMLRCREARALFVDTLNAARRAHRETHEVRA